MRKVRLEDIKDIALNATGDIDTIYLHWTAGHYGQFFSDYHINVDADGSVYISTDDFTERKSHTWRRNSRAVGIALTCCAFADTNDLGDEPPTEAQIESTAQVIAVLCKYLELPINVDHVMTHAEAADLDDYGPKTTCERWDCLFLSNGTKDINGGDTLRGKASWYLGSGQIP